MSQSHLTPEQIDAILPQTQCGLCGHGGCMPYAEAIVFDNAAINLCPPGGVKTLEKLGQLTQQDHTPFITEMEKQAKPLMLAVIRENECIGCTKCIVACPVDAILGSAKQMHSVINSECTGCELCIAPCPVDCIEMVAVHKTQTEESKQEQADYWRTRFRAKTERQKKMAAMEKVTKISVQSKHKDYVLAALARVKQKRK